MAGRSRAQNSRRVATAALLLISLLTIAGCASPRQLSGDVGPITAGTTAPPTTSTSPPPPAVSYTPFRYDQAKGNATGGNVTLAVPDWPVEQTSSRYDFTHGGTLLRLDFSVPRGSALHNWQEEAVDFASTHSGYKLLNDIHSINCPKGATGTGQTTDCADWEFTFNDTVNGGTKHAIDRAVVVGNVGFAVYMSASEAEFSQAYKVFQHVSDSIRIG